MAQTLVGQSLTQAVAQSPQSRYSAVTAESKPRSSLTPPIAQLTNNKHINAWQLTRHLESTTASSKGQLLPEAVLATAPGVIASAKGKA